MESFFTHMVILAICLSVVHLSMVNAFYINDNFKVTRHISAGDPLGDSFVINSSSRKHSKDEDTAKAKDDSASDYFEDDSFIIPTSTTTPSEDIPDIEDVSANGISADNPFPKQSSDNDTSADDNSVDDSSADDTSVDDASDNGSTVIMSTTEQAHQESNNDEEAIGDSEEDLTTHENWPLLDHGDRCGRSKTKRTVKSIGGQNANMGEFPWMARLVYRSLTKDFEKGSCGGTIINNRYVVTAAHCCIDDLSVQLSYVRLGEYDVHHTKDCFKGKCAPQALEVGVESSIRHPGYVENFFLKDICLLRLSEEIEFTDYIQPICVPTTKDLDENPWVGVNMTVAGWGTLENLPTTRRPDVLQKVELKVMPTDECSELLGKELEWKWQICAVGMEAAHSPCAGDSGGPLMYHDGTGDSERQVLVGVVSAGVPCSHDYDIPLPALFTRVSNCMPWILNNISE